MCLRKFAAAVVVVSVVVYATTAAVGGHPSETQSQWRPPDPVAWAQSQGVSYLAHHYTEAGWGCYLDQATTRSGTQRSRAACWRSLASLATVAYPVPGGAEALVRVVACESAGDPLAVGGVGELGLAQHHPHYVEARLERVGWPPVKGLAHQPWPNLLAAAELAHSSGWAPWTCRP